MGKEMKLEQKHIQYLKILRDNSSVLQPEIRDAVKYALGQLSQKDCRHSFQYQGKIPNTGVLKCRFCGAVK